MPAALVPVVLVVAPGAAETGTEAAAADTRAEREAGTVRGSESGTETETATETATESGTETESGTGSGTGSGTENVTEIAIETGAYRILTGVETDVAMASGSGVHLTLKQTAIGLVEPGLDTLPISRRLVDTPKAVGTRAARFGTTTGTRTLPGRRRTTREDGMSSKTKDPCPKNVIIIYFAKIGPKAKGFAGSATLTRSSLLVTSLEQRLNIVKTLLALLVLAQPN